MLIWIKQLFSFLAVNFEIQKSFLQGNMVVLITPFCPALTSIYNTLIPSTMLKMTISCCSNWLDITPWIYLLTVFLDRSHLSGPAFHWLWGKELLMNDGLTFTSSYSRALLIDKLLQPCVFVVCTVIASVKKNHVDVPKREVFQDPVTYWIKLYF